MLEITIRIKNNVIRDGKIVAEPGEILLEGRSKAGVGARQIAEAILSGAADLEERKVDVVDKNTDGHGPTPTDTGVEPAVAPKAAVVRKR